MNRVDLTCYQQALAYEYAGQWAQAAAAYLHVIASADELLPRVQYRLAVAYSALNKADQACQALLVLDYEQACVSVLEQAIATAVQSNTADANTENLTRAADWWQQGLSHYATQHWAQAAGCMQQALYREPDHCAHGQYLLGAVLYRAGAVPQACQALLALVIDRDPYAEPQGCILTQAAPEVAVSYVHYRTHLPIARKVVVYESYAGVGARCNPLAIFNQRALYDAHDDWLHVWVLNEAENIPKAWHSLANVVCVPVNSQRYAQFMATAAFCINNSNAATYIVRRAEQKFLNTWHGTPLKGLGRDIKTEFNEFGPVQYNFLQSTHLISPNTHTTDVLLDRYDLRCVYRGQLAQTGYPRIDATVASSAERQRELKQQLGLAPDQPVVLFAPTWRGTFESMAMDFQRLEDDLSAMFNQGAQLLFRGHYFLEEQLSQRALDCTVVPSSMDSNELLAIVDVLITDYSSICVDFMPRQRPILYYVYDQEQYAQERGLYLWPQQMPGVTCTTRSQLVAALHTALDTVQNAAPDAPTEAYDLSVYNDKDDGAATRRVIDFFFYDDQRHVVHSAADVAALHSILVYPGSMAPGPRTEQIIAQVQHLNQDNVRAIVSSCPDTVQAHSNSPTLTALFTPAIQHIPKVGDWALTRLESECLAQAEQGVIALSPAQQAVIHAVYAREFLRVYGCAKLDAVLDCVGTDEYWRELLAAAERR